MFYIIINFLMSYTIIKLVNYNNSLPLELVFNEYWIKNWSILKWILLILYNNIYFKLYKQNEPLFSKILSTGKSIKARNKVDRDSTNKRNISKLYWSTKIKWWTFKKCPIMSRKEFNVRISLCKQHRCSWW